jgi:hypothetical protein
LMPFSCFNSKNACFDVSFDSYFANDKYVTIEDHSLLSVLYMHDSSSIGMLLPGWRTQAWCYLLDDCLHFLELSAIRTVTYACLIYPQVSIDHRWESAAVTHHSQSYCHMRNRQNMFFLISRT